MRWLVAVLVILAGCASPPAEVTSDPSPFQDVETGPDTGAISGVIVDPTIAPLADVEVRLHSGPTATTGPDGAFVFRDLEPGIYLLNATGPGLVGMQSSADVRAGEVSKLRIMLEPDLLPVPIHYTLKFDGYIELYPTVMGGVVNILYTGLIGGNDPLCKCEFRFTTEDPGVKTIVIESVWDPSLSNPVDTTHQLQFSAVDGQGPIHGSRQETPMYYTVDMEASEYDLSSPVEWRSLIGGSYAFVNIQESYEEFVTVFANAPAPDGWSLVAGDE